jgi:hypothetical protein
MTRLSFDNQIRNGADETTLGILKILPISKGQLLQHGLILRSGDRTGVLGFLSGNSRRGCKQGDDQAANGSIGIQHHSLLDELEYALPACET